MDTISGALYASAPPPLHTLITLGPDNLTWCGGMVGLPNANGPEWQAAMLPKLRTALKPHAVSRHATHHAVIPGGRAISWQAQGPSPHVGISSVHGHHGHHGPPKVPPAVVPLFSRPSILNYMMMDTRKIPCWNFSDFFDFFTLCLFALLQQCGTLEANHSVVSRVYPVTTFPGSPPFLTWQLSWASVRLGFQCT